MTSTSPDKYLFDLNNFDKGAFSDSDKPPAPTFSQEELDQARSEGFNDGVKKGLADSQVSRDQQILDLTRKMAADIKTLITAEQHREQQFQAELLVLAQTLYKKTFPVLNEEYGLPQITDTIQTLLNTIDDSSSIVIEVAPQDFEDLGDRLRSFLTDHDRQISLLPQGSITSGSFRIKWKDGGACRDVEELAQRLADAVARSLAENQDLSQNNPHER